MKMLKIKDLYSADYNARIIRCQQIGRDNGHGCWHGEVPVHPQLKEYMEAVEKAMPHIKFTPSSRLTAGGYISKFYAVMDGNPFTLGHVGYADTSVHKNSGPSFYVMSRKIRNGKYAAHRDQHHTISSKDIAKAVKAARANLVPFSNEELILHMYGDVRDKARLHIEKMAQKAYKISHQYTTRYTIQLDFVEEMKHLKDMGVQFKTDYFKAAMDGIDEAYAEWEDVKNYKQAMTFVRVEQGDYPMVHVVKGDTVTNNHGFVYNGEMQTTTYPIDQLPDDVARGVAVLSILEDEQYAERVGYRSTDYIFWLERDLNND